MLQDMEQQKDLMNRFSHCDGYTGREKWIGANGMMDLKFVLFHVVVCLTWLNL